MQKRPDAIGIIPARAQSSRFPLKVIAEIRKKPMLQYIWESAKTAKSLSRVLIATDSEEVARIARGFGAEAVMTGEFATGSDRVASIAKNLEFPIVVNLQADEPTLPSSAIDDLVEALASDPETGMATLAVRMERAEDLQNPNIVKCVFDTKGRALYFSRQPIGADSSGKFWKHIGIYAYRKDVLLRLSKMPPSPLEIAERLEQLRALEDGVRIALRPVVHDTVAVDVPEDIFKVESYLAMREGLLESPK